MNQKIQNKNQNVEPSYDKTGSEYVLVNGQDLWNVDYVEQTATLREDITLEDLEVNNDIAIDLEQWGLREYLESNDFEVNEEESTEEKLFFKGVGQ